MIEIDLNGTDTSLVTYMGHWFHQDEYSITNLKKIKGKINLSSATDTSYMFYDCQKVDELDTSEFFTSNVTNMDRMFGAMKVIKYLDVSMMDTSKVTNMFWMFRKCLQLKNIDLSNFDTSNVTNMQGMFVEDAQLQTITLGENFNTAKVEDMYQMFSQCTNLTTIYAYKDFELSPKLNSSNIFNSSIRLVGGNGTIYSNEGKSDASYASIDRDGNKGYFTSIEDKP